MKHEILNECLKQESKGFITFNDYKIYKVLFKELNECLEKDSNTLKLIIELKYLIELYESVKYEN